MTRLAQRERKNSGTRLRAVTGALALASLLVPAVVATRPGQAPPEIPTSSVPTYSVLYSFKGTPDGAFPAAGVLRDAAGNLYGTTLNGGTLHAGVVFKLDTTGKETVLYSFKNGADGGYPRAGLVRDAAGNLYGTTLNGGTLHAGVVFKLDTTGKETVLYSFKNGADGGYPRAGLVRDTAGNLYGTTGSSTAGTGVVFKLTP